VLDIGCNTGHFSELAAKTGANVVALDSDPVCVGQTYRRAVTNSLSVLPLVANIARPSPALGWRNGEQASLLERLSGRFDLVLMLAVLHHLLVTERIPLPEILRLADDLTTDLLVLEYVGPSDPMFRKLVRGRGALYAHVTPEWFEAACTEHFEIVESQKLAEADRRLYLLKKRT
jgi:SAM-dependent methyltransferase